MLQIKELRAKNKLSQKSLAEKLGVSQQAIGKWESGKAEPTLKNLKGLADIFGMSLDDFTSHYYQTVSLDDYKLISAFDERMTYGFRVPEFWGNVGFQILGQSKSKWYPIVFNEIKRLKKGMYNYEAGWFYFKSLNNKLVFINSEHIVRMSLLDDACDYPDDDWELEWDDHFGMPDEFYKNIENYYYDDYNEIPYSDLLKIKEMVKDNYLDSWKMNKMTLSVHLIDSSGNSSYIHPDSYDQFSEMQETLVSSKFTDFPFRCWISSDEISYCFNMNNIAIMEVPLLKIK